MCEKEYLNFIDRIVEKDLEEGKCKEIHTRFPPEPNGYLHIGSAYAINISFGIAKKYGGKFNLRFDDTNPKKEDIEYINSIKEDMAWVGFDYEDRCFYASDYNDFIYECAIKLIKDGKAFVCDLSPEEIRDYRGTLTEPGKDSPYRNRTIEENLELFERMKNREYKEGEKVLRAKIDMASPNINMRDPVIYRINYDTHYRQGDKWCIYPMYDFAHPLEDYVEGISHSLCSQEFKDHRPLYDWVLENAVGETGKQHPRQIEFARMNLSGVVTSKRYLRALVASGIIDGWDDPRMCTLKALRRRGYTRESILSFLGEIGVAKSDTTVDVSMLEQCLRQELKEKVPNVMAVLDPIKVTITNMDDDFRDEFIVDNNEENVALGQRKVVFTKNLFIERDDFCEVAPNRKYKRLVLGGEVRLKYAYIIKCNEVVKDDNGNVIELKCTYDKDSRGGSAPDGRKIKGTIQWVNSIDSVKCKVRLFEDLFLGEPDIDNLIESVNPNSLKVMENALIEKGAVDIGGNMQFQFMRCGYFIKDSKLCTEEELVFNRTVELKGKKPVVNN